jgi:ketosteroid isomerase-like protein
MRPNKPIEKWFAELKAKPSAELDARVHRAINEARAERKQTPSAGLPWPNIWRMIMKTPMTKLAAAGLAAAALFASILVLDKTTPSAFGLDQVIAASKGVRFLHIRIQHGTNQEPNEFWIASDESGHVAKARYYLPETEDGAKLITWTPERTEIWFQSKHGFLTLQTKGVEKWMQDLLEQGRPQLVTEKLKEAQKAGKVDLDIHKPTSKEEPIKMVSVSKTNPSKQVYWIDQKTDLISSIEFYRTEAGADVLLSKTEFLDYNVPIDDKMFSLRDQLPKDVRIADQVTQVSGVAQGDLTDDQAAAQTAREFFQALVDKDYKKAGLVMGGELEQYTKEEYGKLNVTAIVSIGPAIPQPDWEKRGFKVPCEVELTEADGQKSVWRSGAYVRPGDDEKHPDHWNITGGVSAGQAGIKILPDNQKYEQMTPKQAAEGFFKACATENWEEFAKFWPGPATGEQFQHMKEFLGGLEVISIGEPYQSGQYPGWYVPYEIKFRPADIYVRVSNTNAAKRYVMNGLYDSKRQPMQKLDWTQEPEVLAKDDVYAQMSPAAVVKAYFDACSKGDWAALRKLTPESDVAQTKQEFAAAEKQGMDPHTIMPAMEVGEAVWSPEESAFFVKCRMVGVKKWNLAVRNDNPANRYLFDGGL